MSKPVPKFLKNPAVYTGISFLIVGGIFAMIMLFSENKEQDQATSSLPVSTEQRIEKPFQLTNESISTSSIIQINQPEQATAADMQSYTSFSPRIDGKWNTDNEKLYFKPKKPLEIGKYYKASFEKDGKMWNSEFRVEADPEIDMIFPHADQETHEQSDITLMFNRPMVALSSVENMKPEDIPVAITPVTKGSWKWIGSKTLQFHPEEKLLPSSNYTIEVLPEFQSLDGLSVRARTHSFTTRALRYANAWNLRPMTQVTPITNTIQVQEPVVQIPQANLNQNTILNYRQPITIGFNQPVDLGMTLPYISVVEQASKEAKLFEAKYKQVTIDGETIVDTRVIEVFAKQDQFERELLWDFESSYTLRIEKAIPAEGEIVLNTMQTINAQIKPAINTISTSSDRISNTRLDFFDPAGTIRVSFFEEIDIDLSTITADEDISQITYTARCEDINDSRENCPKTVDKSSIDIDFDETTINRDDSFTLVFNKIVTPDKLQINPSAIEYKISTLPSLKVLSSSYDKENPGNVYGMHLCTTMPLNAPDPEEIDSILQADTAFIYERWNTSYQASNSSNECAPLEYITRISYKLTPKTPYTFTFNLTDTLEDTTSYTRDIVSEAVSDRARAFRHFQGQYVVTPPTNTTLTYTAENMEKTEIDICQISPQDMMQRLSQKLRGEENPSNLSCVEQWSKTITLQDQYWVKQPVSVDLGKIIENKNPLGHFIVSITHPEYGYTHHQTKKFTQSYERTYLSVTNIGIVEKNLQISQESYGGGALDPAEYANLKNLYWITDLNTHAPVATAQIQSFRLEQSNQPTSLIAHETGATDANGIVRLTPGTNHLGIIASKDDDIALLHHYDNALNHVNNAVTAEKIYTYTDRPIYRPGHTVHIKGIHRIGYDTNYEVFTENPVEVKIYNSQGEEIYNEPHTPNNFGTFETDITLDLQASLGTYRIQTGNFQSTFEIEQYVPAAFKVDLTPEQPEYVSQEEATIKVDARYYFDAPVEGGEVTYQVVAQHFYFDRAKDPSYQYAGGSFRCYYYCDYGDTFITRGSAELAADGTASIKISTDLAELLSETDQQSKIFTIHATVQNESGQSIKGTSSFIVHQSDHYVGIKTDKYFITAGDEIEVLAQTLDTQGETVKQADLSLKVNRLEWKKRKRQEVDGGFYYRWEEVRTEIDTHSFETNNKGNWSKNVEIKDEGQYELIITSTDSNRNSTTATRQLYVSGTTYESYHVRPTNNTNLQLVTETQSAEVGDTLQIIIPSPYEKAKALISIERGDIYSYEIVNIESSLFAYDFKVTEEHIPNIFASVVLLGTEDDTPEMKFGQATFQINTKEKALNIDVQLDKTTYLPGEQVTGTVLVQDSNKNSVQTEISLAVVDMSVLALKGNPAKNPVMFFYNGFPLTIRTSSNIKNILHTVDIAKGTKGGGGGDAAADLAHKKRGEFRDTAFWEAQVTTDSEGKAEISFTLPDNLTEWQLETVGVSKDTKLGVDYQSFVVRKPLMLTPLKPRFILPGDEFKLGAKVINQTGTAQTLEVSITTATLISAKDPLQKITLEDGATEIIYFDVYAPLKDREGKHEFTLSAKNSKFEDTVEQLLPIQRNAIYETVATSGWTTEEQTNEYLMLPKELGDDQGFFKVTTSSTLAHFLQSSMQYLLAYPYGCLEQTASKLSSIALAKTMSDLKNMDQHLNFETVEFEGTTYTMDELAKVGINRINNLQSADGGFQYYPNSYRKSDPYLTSYILNTLLELDSAGYKTDKNVIERGDSYLTKQRLEKEVSFEENIAILHTLFDTRTFLEETSVLSAYAKTLERNFQDIPAKLENLASDTLALLATLTIKHDSYFGKRFQKDIFEILENRIELDSRGAFIPNIGDNREHHQSVIKNTSLYLTSIIMMEDEDHPLFDELLRWILGNKDKQGGWGTTHNTKFVMNTLIDYMLWKQEHLSEFDLDLLLNDSIQSELSYSPEIMFAKDTNTISIGDLDLGELNILSLVKDDQNNKTNTLYYDIEMRYYLPMIDIPTMDEGFHITRNIYEQTDSKFTSPLTTATVGDVMVGKIEIMVPKERQHVAIEDFIPAGMELVNFNLSTEAPRDMLEAELLDQEDWRNSAYSFYPEHTEYRDDRLFLYIGNLSPGRYQYTYYVRALIPGNYQYLPAMISEMYTPENFGRTAGGEFVVVEKE